ncbi:MAG: STAS domain-containing protein [Kiritimatiellae bacterium]|nr:STAS domain-containing protein [Kiritimatiellia bacterium]MDW8458722.1 STAS domain-containing protein [Verrucomicrobiota bacterium]
MANPVLEIETSLEGNAVVAKIRGPVDSATIDFFKEKLDPVCMVPGARVLLDCSELTYLNSRAIGLLMKYHRNLMITRGRFVLCSLNEKLVRTFDLLQIGKALATYKSREEALAAIR